MTFHWRSINHYDEMTAMRGNNVRDVSKVVRILTVNNGGAEEKMEQ